MRLKMALVLGIFGVATACGKSDEGGKLVNQTSAVAGARRDVGGAQSGAIPSPARASTARAQSEVEPSMRLSCSAEIGAAAAAKKVALCRNVSPATHPPCNAANSCALIEDEIARGCAFLASGDRPLPASCSPDPRSPEAAADVVRRYYAAINAHDYETAWSQWGADGPRGQTFAAFQEGFARTREAGVAIGELGPSEGAAGTIYQSVPVTVDATLDDGTRQRFQGRYVIRRANNVDGVVEPRWRIDSARLQPVGR